MFHSYASLTRTRLAMLYYDKGQIEDARALLDMSVRSLAACGAPLDSAQAAIVYADILLREAREGVSPSDYKELYVT